MKDDDEIYKWVEKLAEIHLESNDKVDNLVKHLSDAELSELIEKVQNYDDGVEVKINGEIRDRPTYVKDAIWRWQFKLHLREILAKMKFSGIRSWCVYHDCALSDCWPQHRE